MNRNDEGDSDIRRRSLVKGAIWSVPVIAASVAAPAVRASGSTVTLGAPDVQTVVGLDFPPNDDRVISIPIDFDVQPFTTSDPAQPADLSTIDLDPSTPGQQVQTVVQFPWVAPDGIEMTIPLTVSYDTTTHVLTIEGVAPSRGGALAIPMMTLPYTVSTADGSVISPPATIALHTVSGSDVRLKENVRPLVMRNDVQLYSFTYKGGDGTVFVGVLAQEMQVTHPDAVVIRPDGYLAVDYARLGVPFTRLTDFER